MTEEFRRLRGGTSKRSEILAENAASEKGSGRGILAGKKLRIEETLRVSRLASVTIRTQEREKNSEQVERIWSSTSKAGWTRRMIPCVRRWMKYSRLKSISYHTVQALSGHGCFQWYLHKRKRALDARCFHCGYLEDTVKHTLFWYPYWSEAK